MSFVSVISNNANSKFEGCLHGLASTDKWVLFSISLMSTMCRELPTGDERNIHMQMCHGSFCHFAGLEIYLGWLTKVHNYLTSEGQEDRLLVPRHGAAVPLWTQTHTQCGEAYWSRSPLERSGNICLPRDTLQNKLSHPSALAGPLDNTAMCDTLQAILDPVSMLSVHFVYKKTGMELVFCTNFVYRYNPGCTVTTQEPWFELSFSKF